MIINLLGDLEVPQSVLTGTPDEQELKLTAFIQGFVDSHPEYGIHSFYVYHNGDQMLDPIFNPIQPLEELLNG